MVKLCVPILTLLLTAIVTGCGGSVFQFERNIKPDDAISKAICEAVGQKKMHYSGKEYSDSVKVTWYGYEVRDYEDEDLLTDMIKAVNTVMKEKRAIGKIYLAILEETPGGAETVVSIRNYYDCEDRYEQYEVLQCLYISGTERSDKGDSSPYNKASTYINLPDIKSLVVSQKIAKAAEEEGIDWYEIWPDLEYYEVLED